MSEPKLTETKTQANESEAKSRDERVAFLAFQIWEEEGRPEGRAETHWCLACEMVDAEDAAQQPLPGWLNKAEATPSVEMKSAVHELKKKSAA